VAQVSFEGTRLSAQHLADAYEQLVPVLSRRVATRTTTAASHDEPRYGVDQDRPGRQAC
jgi:hypothetical protein